MVSEVSVHGYLLPSPGVCVRQVIMIERVFLQEGKGGGHYSWLLTSSSQVTLPNSTFSYEVINGLIH
jgi:hypothetical protein